MNKSLDTLLLVLRTSNRNNKTVALWKVSLNNFKLLERTHKYNILAAMQKFAYEFSSRDNYVRRKTNTSGQIGWTSAIYSTYHKKAILRTKR